MNRFTFCAAIVVFLITINECFVPSVGSPLLFVPANEDYSGSYLGFVPEEQSYDNSGRNVRIRPRTRLYRRSDFLSEAQGTSYCVKTKQNETLTA